MFDITIEELRRMKTIHKAMEQCAELYGQAYHGVREMSGVGDVEEDGFSVVIYSKAGENGFIIYKDMLSTEWHNKMHLMISQREIDRKKKEAATLAKNQKKKDEDDRKLYEKLKLKFQSESVVLDNLLKDTEPLGSEFDQILQDNLWDLYERS